MVEDNKLATNLKLWQNNCQITDLGLNQTPVRYFGKMSEPDSVNKQVLPIYYFRELVISGRCPDTGKVTSSNWNPVWKICFTFA